MPRRQPVPGISAVTNDRYPDRRSRFIGSPRRLLRPFLRPAAAKKITALVALAAAVIGISAIAISLMGAANVLMKDPRVTYDPGK